MKSFDTKGLPLRQIHSYLLGSISPRPIAFVSTIDLNGKVNLAPFSYFNAFSANPPVIVFSPANSGIDGSKKHSLLNVQEVPECVVNIVSWDIVEQMSLSSTAYPKGVNEFLKAGLTEVASEMIRPPRVKEAKVQFECKVIEVKTLGAQGGAGNLVIAEVLKMHLDEVLLDDEDRFMVGNLDVVGRMGGNIYTRALNASFTIPKPIGKNCMGVDALPEQIRLSEHLSGNDLGKLGSLESLPNEDAIVGVESSPEASAIIDEFGHNSSVLSEKLYLLSKKHLKQNRTEHALKLLMLAIKKA